jgi:3',5'-cyclic AMP phosphodiesterase CpdA
MLIAHLSDPHLRARGQLYQNIIDSNAMFLTAIQHLASMDPQPDLVILSGDLVDMGTEAEYAVAAEILASVPQPVLVIPGNHDHRERFRQCFGHNAYMAKSGPLHFDSSPPR